jgi:hypothetical protein
VTPAKYQTSPVFTPGYLSRGQVRSVARNTQYLYDLIRAWPIRAQYHATATTALYMNYPQNATYPVWVGSFIKSTGRDELYVRFAYQCAVSSSYAHRADIYLYDMDGAGTLLGQVTMTATSLTVYTGTFNISGLVSADEGYYVIIYATRTGASRNTTPAGYPGYWHRIQIDRVVGRKASGASVSGYPVAPTFSGDATAIGSPTKLNGLCASSDWLFDRVTRHRIPGYAGVLQKVLDTQHTNAERVHHATALYLPGRTTLHVRGRYEAVNQQTIGISSQGVTLDSTTYNHPARTIYEGDDFDQEIALSGLGYATGDLIRIGVDYTRTSAARLPRPRLSIYDISLIGSHSSAGWAAMADLAVLTGMTYSSLCTQLDVISANLGRVKSQYDALAPHLEADEPFVIAWDTSLRYAYHPQGDPNSIDRNERNLLAPAAFTRRGDVLDCWGVGMEIVWGIPSWDMDADKQPATYETLYSYKVSESPDAIEQRTVYLDAVEDKGMPLAKGMDYWLRGPRVYGAWERYLFGAAV